jgi:hypothetical protein
MTDTSIRVLTAVLSHSPACLCAECLERHRMNAKAIKPYTAATCKRIVAACESELATRNKLNVPAWRYAEEMWFRGGLREVMWCAIAAQDDPAGRDALHAALVDLDSYPIWEAAR